MLSHGFLNNFSQQLVSSLVKCEGHLLLRAEANNLIARETRSAKRVNGFASDWGIPNTVFNICCTPLTFSPLIQCVPVLKPRRKCMAVYTVVELKPLHHQLILRQRETKSGTPRQTTEPGGL